MEKNVLNWTDYIDSNYLSGYEVEKPVSVTLEKVNIKKVRSLSTGVEEDVIILHWKGAKKGQILSKRVARVMTVINDMKKDANTWVGCTVVLYVTIEKHGGKTHAILNVRPVK